MKSLYIVTLKDTTQHNLLCQLMLSKPENLGFPGCWEIASDASNQDLLIQHIATTLQHCLDNNTHEHVLFGWQASENQLLSTLLSHLDSSRYQVTHLKLTDLTTLLGRD